MTRADAKPWPKPWSEWRHVVKLDPDRPVADEVLAAVGRSGTDAVFVGGTQGITYENVNALFGRLRRHAPDKPIWQEVSGEDSVVDGMSGYAIPVVLNASSPQWIIRKHAEALQRYGSFLDWSRVLVEGYLVLNPEAEVAKLTGADAELTREQAAGYAMAGERLFSLPVLYVEYSGAYGDVEVVKEVARACGQAHVFYGGGIDSYERAAEIGRHADTIVVGNALYGADWRRVLADTVRAVKET